MVNSLSWASYANDIALLCCVLVEGKFSLHVLGHAAISTLTELKH